MANINIRQITKSNNKTKLIEFNDKMQFNDFSEETGVIKSSTHNKFSRIQLTIVDWTEGKKEKAIVVSHNITPSNLKLVAEMVLRNNTAVFEQIDKYTKKAGYLEQKINFRKKNERGCSPVTFLNIRYQSNMNSPWTITIENGEGIPQISSIGGVTIKAGSYQKIASATVFLSTTEFVSKMIEVKDYIQSFETSHFLKMLHLRAEKEKEKVEMQANDD